MSDNKENRKKCTIHSIMGSLFILLLNICGTIAWVSLYVNGRYTEWWVIVLIIICGLTAFFQLLRICK
jgi:membrane protein YdbS with pleckstrin-like domain